MYFKNKSDKVIILAEVLGGKNLTIPANGTSQNFVPNKELLSKFLINSEYLELHATRGSELQAASDIDKRVETLIILD